jgi:hypothetical protein
LILKKLGYGIQQLDWIGKKDGLWTIFEVKTRELFNPPPFLGTVLDKRQVYLRNLLKDELKLRTVLIVFEKSTDNVYWQYLDILESGKHFDTRNEIRIYPIENFIKFNENELGL